MLAESTAWVENSFTALEDLFLSLIRSSRDLVDLHLGLNPCDDAGSLSAEALAAVLSETHRLERLSASHLTQSSRIIHVRGEQHARSRPPTLALISVRLQGFDFDGSGEYLEDLVSRIDAPILEQLDLSFPQRVFDVPQLSQLVSRTKHLNSPPRRTAIRFADDELSIEHHFRHLESTPPGKTFSLIRWIRKPRAASDWVASQVLHICGQLSPFTSSVERLMIDIQKPSDREGDRDIERWLQLLDGFRSVKDLYLLCRWWDWGPACCMQRALEESTVRESTQEVLSALRILRMNEIRLRSQNTRCIAAFANARRRTGRPVMVCKGPSQEF